jgi:hypothetical protein
LGDFLTLSNLCLSFLLHVANWHIFCSVGRMLLPCSLAELHSFCTCQQALVPPVVFTHPGLSIVIHVNGQCNFMGVMLPKFVEIWQNMFKVTGVITIIIACTTCHFSQPAPFARLQHDHLLPAIALFYLQTLSGSYISLASAHHTSTTFALSQVICLHLLAFVCIQV